jgi:hypothetical protein
MVESEKPCPQCKCIMAFAKVEKLEKNNMVFETVKMYSCLKCGYVEKVD